MPWHAITFDGLGTDAEFAQTDPAETEAGTVVSVNAPLVERTMAVIGPHIRKAVSEGLVEAANSIRGEYRRKAIWGAAITGGFMVGSLLLLWKMSSRMAECCPVQPRVLKDCCP